MQQDCSTYWRLGTNRSIQFRFQVIGIAMGAVMSVVLARLFMKAYPVLAVNQFGTPARPAPKKWQAAMTHVRRRAQRPRRTRTRTSCSRSGSASASASSPKCCARSSSTTRGCKAWVKRGGFAYYTDLAVDCVFLPSPCTPRALAAFVELGTSVWFGLGGIFSSLLQTWQAKQAEAEVGRARGGRARGPARGHEHDVARRWRPHRRRSAFAALGLGIGLRCRRS